MICVTSAGSTSTIASALFSCSVTQAVRPSGATAMYSGSMSWATVARPSAASRIRRDDSHALPFQRLALGIEAR